MNGFGLVGGCLFMGGLVCGAMAGDVLFLIVPVVIGLLFFAIASWQNQQYVRRTEKWRANYPNYKY